MRTGGHQEVNRHISDLPDKTFNNYSISNSQKNYFVPQAADKNGCLYLPVSKWMLDNISLYLNIVALFPL